MPGLKGPLWHLCQVFLSIQITHVGGFVEIFERLGAIAGQQLNPSACVEEIALSRVEGDGFINIDQCLVQISEFSIG